VKEEAMAETQTAGRRAGLKRQEALLGRLTRGADRPPNTHPAGAAPAAPNPAEAAPASVSTEHSALQAEESTVPISSSLPASEPSEAKRSSPFAKLATNNSSPKPAPTAEAAPAAQPPIKSSFETLVRPDAGFQGTRGGPRSDARRVAAPEWNDEHRPAGSAFSSVEWEAARRFGPESLEKIAELGERTFAANDRSAWRFHVVEYVTAQERALLYAPSAMVEAEDKTTSRVIDGRVVKESTRPPVDAGSLFLLPLDGCMLLGPGAVTPFDVLAKPYSTVTHDHPPEGDEQLYPWKVRVIHPTTPPHGEMWATASMDVTLLEQDGEAKGVPAVSRPRG
jgi:hypothetical protein